LPATTAWKNDGSANQVNPFYEQAKSAFRQGSYRDGAHLAAHAMIDEPKNPAVHLLFVLSMFAGGEYRGAAMEAHSVALLGKTPAWAEVFEFYGDPAPFTKQLRALEKFATEKPQQPEARFLLGFLYMVNGYRDAAKEQFLAALKLTPRDRVAAQLLRLQGGEVPADIARQLAESPPLPELPKPPEPQLPPAK
jgi:thioredoxin-like negative regulator of GroEL